MPSYNNIILMTLCCFSSGLFAQTESNDPATWNVKLGFGMMANSQAWKDIDTQVALIPYIEVNHGNWYFDVENPVTYKLNVNSSTSLYMGIGIRSDHYDPADVEITKRQHSAVFNGYKEPHTETVVNYGASFGLLSVNASTDISNNSNSQTLGATVEVPVYQSTTGFSLATLLTTNWMDSRYVNYYYGITEKQADNSVERDQYRTSSAINYDLTLQAMYPVNEQWVLLGKLSRTRLANEITNSPLVDTRHQDFLGVLAIYQF